MVSVVPSNFTLRAFYKRRVGPLLLRVVNWERAGPGSAAWAKRVDRVRAATQVSLTAIAEAKRQARPGTTERQLHAAIKRHVKRAGYRFGFPLLCSAGPNTGRVHARASDYAIRAGDPVVVDIGLKNRLLADWSSDVTRTFFVGPPPARVRHVYELVERAQVAALQRVKAGVPAALVDQAARRVVEAGGLAIPHSVGHAVGRYEHRPPLIAPWNAERLVAHQVVTVEPGVYLKEQFGVRIEDLVRVTPAGCEVLSLPPGTPADAYLRGDRRFPVVPL